MHSLVRQMTDMAFYDEMRYDSEMEPALPASDTCKLESMPAAPRQDSQPVVAQATLLSCSRSQLPSSMFAPRIRAILLADTLLASSSSTSLSPN